jgi:hypothetical protein
VRPSPFRLGTSRRLRYWRLQTHTAGDGNHFARAALAVAYAELLPPPPSAATDTVLTTAPRDARSGDASDLVTQNALNKLMRRIRSQNSSVSASRSAGGIGVRVSAAPALLMR